MDNIRTGIASFVFASALFSSAYACQHDPCPMPFNPLLGTEKNDPDTFGLPDKLWGSGWEIRGVIRKEAIAFAPTIVSSLVLASDETPPSTGATIMDILGCKVKVEVQCGG